VIFSCSNPAGTSPPVDNTIGTTRLAEHLLEVSREPAPPGVDEELFTKLKTELAIFLTELDKSAAVSPHGSYNAVNDLTLL